MMHHHLAAAGPISLAAAFAAGLAASLHCVAMCGGIAGALGLRARLGGEEPRRAALHAVIQQVGRIASYALAGAVCGSLGGTVAQQFDLPRAALVLRAAAGLLLIAMSLRVLLGWRVLEGVERLGGRVWGRLTPRLRARRFSGWGGALLLGALWGWLPCGLVYSMLVFAALSGGAGEGATTMLLFGVGTLPALLAASLAGAQARRFAPAARMHAAAGVMLLLFGLLSILGPLLMSHA